MRESGAAEPERLAVLAAFDGLAPCQCRDYRWLGMPLIVLTLAALILLPPALGWLGIRLPTAGRGLLLGAGGVLTLAGILLTLMGGMWAEGEFADRIEQALHTLHPAAADTVAPEARLLAAVTVIACSHYSGGPWTRATFDPQQVGSRLGAALPYVQQVETILVGEGRAYPVFT